VVVESVHNLDVWSWEIRSSGGFTEKIVWRQFLQVQELHDQLINVNVRSKNVPFEVSSLAANTSRPAPPVSTERNWTWDHQNSRHIPLMCCVHRTVTFHYSLPGGLAFDQRSLQVGSSHIMEFKRQQSAVLWQWDMKPCHLAD